MEMTETTNAAKWLRCLFYVHLASVVISPFNGTWKTWLGLLIVAGETYFLYRLTALGGRYQKAALFNGCLLLCSLLMQVGTGSMLLTLAATVLGLIATWQEYHGHSELVAALDAKLSKNWHSLFYWELIISVLAGVLTTTTTVILVLGELGAAAISAVVTVATILVSLVLGILYLVYLHKTAKLFGV